MRETHPETSSGQDDLEKTLIWGFKKYPNLLIEVIGFT